MLKKLNPFATLPNPREVWAWGMYDLANQSFTLLIVSLFYAIYFQNYIAATPEQGKLLWGVAIGASSLFIVVLGPVLGAAADAGGTKKRWLAWLGIGCGVFTIALAFTGPGMVWLAFALFILANVMFMAGENFLAAFLPEISTRDTISKVSAIGWTMGYLGAMLVLPLAAIIMLSSSAMGGASSTVGFRLVCVFAGVWFILNALPTLFILKERNRPETRPSAAELAISGMSRVVQTLKHVPRYRELAVFLAAFFLYSAGVSIVIGFAGELAYQYLGTGPAFLIFCWVLSLVAGLGSAFTGIFQPRLGHLRTVGISLIVWIATSVGAALMPAPGASAALWPIWLVGIGAGWGLGMNGNASRTVVGVFTPAHKTAEFFGLWGLAYKLASVVGPPMYGLMFATAGRSAAWVMVAGFFVAGLAVLVCVRVDAGRRAAEQAEREFSEQNGASARA